MIRPSIFPDKWPAVRLEEAVDFLDYKRRPVTESDRKPGPYPYYGANGCQGMIDGYLFDEPLVLLAEDGGHFGIEGKNIAYQVDGKCWVNNHAHVLKPKPEANIRFLTRVLEQYDVSGIISGTTRGKLTKGAATGIVIPLPSLSEQERIAGILDKADGVRRKREDALRLTDELLRSVFLEMFGDPVTNPKGWPVRPLAEGVESFEGGWNVNPIETPRTDGIRVLKVSAVTSGEYRANESKSFNEDEAVPEDFLVRKEDLLISRANTAELVGAVAYVWETSGLEMLPDKLWRFVWPQKRSIEPLFMLHLARSVYFRKQLIQRATGSSGSMKNIGKAKMLEIPIPYPPIDLQKKFTEIAIHIRETSLKATTGSENAELLFAALQQRAFSGQL
jgi:type I restriction enzyme S subunit